MAEKSSGSPKRTTRPRRTTKAAAGDESHVARPAIEDAFEEAAAARAEFDAPPTERDMDFEALEAPAPRKPARPRTRKAAVVVEEIKKSTTHAPINQFLLYLTTTTTTTTQPPSPPTSLFQHSLTLS